MNKSAIELSKWYMDCVSSEGDALVAYAAEMRWRGLTIGYQAALEARGSQPVSSHSSLQPYDPPAVADSGIAWRSRPLGIYGAWTPTAVRPAIHETIYRSPAGSVEWSCLLPAAAARLSTGRGEMVGRGYVEHVQLTVAPWRLPVESLRWGRIADDEQAIVWIQWLGVRPRKDRRPPARGALRRAGSASRDDRAAPAGDPDTTVVYVNGIRVPAVQIDDARVALADQTTIELDRTTVLRSGALGATVGQSVPILRDIAPVRALAVRECKWLSRAVVARRGHPARQTWAIHEVVTWPRPARRARGQGPEN